MKEASLKLSVPFVCINMGQRVDGESGVPDPCSLVAFQRDILKRVFKVILVLSQFP